MSMVVEVPEKVPPFGLLSIAPGVAVTDVVPQARLKWPNDVQWHDAKRSFQTHHEKAMPGDGKADAL